MENIRKPSVAGSFYPASAKELDATLNALFKQTKVIVSELPKILIVPHAGVNYSGLVSAWGFRQLANRNYTRIILLGASHRFFFKQAVIDNTGFWQTPLGKTAIDENLANTLLDNKEIVANSTPHQDEHSLEIELIFLQKILKKFEIVPILLSQTSNELIDNLALKISQNLDDKTLLVVSTDLSHYPPYETANQVDNKTIEAILTGKKDVFINTLAELESAGYPGVETCACGAEAIKVALKVGEILDLEFKKIKYENSGDSSGRKDQVVGYVAIAGYKKNTSVTQPLNKSSQKEALIIARKTLENYLKSPSISFAPSVSSVPSNKSLLSPLGAFVTLRNKNQLRGCIGQFEPDKPLYQVIQEMSLEAANDPRFPPVTAEELPEIKIEISVMTPKKKVTNWQEIKLGKQGVVVRKGLNAGTFLPQVATETGWNLEEFLSHLCAEKTGLPADCYKDPSVNLYTFEAQVFEEKK